MVETNISKEVIQGFVDGTISVESITLFAVVGMVFILFMAVLFWNLITRMVSFVTDIITEISYRTD